MIEDKVTGRQRPRGRLWWWVAAMGLPVLVVAVASSSGPEPEARSAGDARPRSEADGTPMARAVDRLSRNDLQAAEALFAEALAGLREADGQRWVRAAFGYATCLHQRQPITPERIAEADTLYARIVETDRASLFAARALLCRGRIAELRDYPGDRRAPDSARPYFLRVIERWPEHEYAVEAALRYAGTFVEQGYHARGMDATDWEARTAAVREGVDFLEGFLADREPSRIVRGAWEFLGDVYWWYFQDPEPSLRAYLRATGDQRMLEGDDPIPQKLNLDRVNPGFLYWRIAELARMSGQREVAREYYSRLVTEVPSYGQGTMAQIRMREMGFAEDEIPRFETFGKEAR